MKCLLLFVFLTFSLFSFPVSASDYDINRLLPDENEVEGWNPSGAPENYEGDDLFFLINGGADLYYEYGFREVVAEHYIDSENNMIRVEIYRMTDPGAAYGVYSVSASADADVYMIGYKGEITDYHIRFFKDDYYVLVSALDRGENIDSGMKSIAGYIDGQIPEKGAKPSIVNYLPDENFISARYVRGNLGLINVYYFSHEDIFGYSEAVTADYGDFKLIIMAYESEEKSRNLIGRAGERMKEMDRFSGYQEHDTGFSIKDNQDNNLYFSVFDMYGIVFIGSDLTLQPEMFEMVEDSIRGVNLQ